MGNKQSMQGPAQVTARRGDQDNGAPRRAEDSRRHAPQRARGQVCSDLRAHDDQGGLPFSGFLDDRRRSRPRALLDHAPMDVLTRELHALNERSRRQCVVADMKNSHGRMQQLGKAARDRERCCRMR
jgi:hypothetical protein